jgi:hypothetical protein
MNWRSVEKYLPRSTVHKILRYFLKLVLYSTIPLCGIKNLSVLELKSDSEQCSSEVVHYTRTTTATRN